MNKDNFSSRIRNMETELRAFLHEIDALGDVGLLLSFGDDFFDRPEYAIRFYNRAIELDPGNLVATISAGYCYLLAGNDLDAYYMLRRAREIDSTHEDVKKLAASVLSPTSRLPRNLE